MSNVPDITARVRAMEARIAQIAGMDPGGSDGTGRLGFGLALEKAIAEGDGVGGLPTGSTGPAASGLSGQAGDLLSGLGTSAGGSSGLGLDPSGAQGGLPLPTASVFGSTLESGRLDGAVPTATTAAGVHHGHDHGHANDHGGAVGAIRDALRLTPADPDRTSYGRLQAPSDLLGYGNGQVPADALVEIGVGRHRLHAPAAAAFVRMRSDAEAAGVEIGITDSYRPLEVQERLVKEKGLYSQGGLAAVPGTSNHGWGLSVDLDLDDRALSWMRDNAWQYGFVEDVPREPWHWTYRPAAS